MRYRQTHSKGGAKGIAAGFSSNLERRVAGQLKASRVAFEYESRTLRYTKPEEVGRYTPDFILANGVVLEVKGLWETADRKKHKLIKAQFPHLDVRIIFSNSKTTIGKKSRTTYAMYCDALGIPYADQTIPLAWLREPHGEKRWNAIITATN